MLLINSFLSHTQISADRILKKNITFSADFSLYITSRKLFKKTRRGAHII